jgi:ParB/Sulfiredoxin domain
MSMQTNLKMETPQNADDVRKIVEERIEALKGMAGAQETVTVEWRGQLRTIPVISMPVSLLCYNPGTHRIRAQRSMDAGREQELEKNPFGDKAQSYLHQLLMGDPTDPSKVDPSFLALKEDLREHGQSDPGIVTRSGILINGNTRQAALKELGQKNIRVGVLPTDASLEDIESIELSLQLRKDHKRDYSFMNFLLAIEERANANHLPATIQKDFRIKAASFDRSRWILEFVRDAIQRSKGAAAGNGAPSLRLVDFETHQGKLEELYRAYMVLKEKSPDEAEALREQRLLALAMNKSKTDLRLVESDFVKKYMKGVAVAPGTSSPPPSKIPGTSITVPGPSKEVEALRELTTSVLRARAIANAPSAASPDEVTKANEFLGKVEESLVKGLDHAGKQGRVIKRRFAAADRISDACDDLEFAVAAVAEARATSNFDPADLDESLMKLKSNLEKLSSIITRGADEGPDGVAWIRAVGKIVSNQTQNG